MQRISHGDYGHGSGGELNRRGHKGRTDGNHQAVIEALRDAAISAISLAQVGDGCGDILAGYRGANFLLEVKDGTLPPSARELSAAERKFHAIWSGHIDIVYSPEQAVAIVAKRAHELGLA